MPSTERKTVVLTRDTSGNAAWKVRLESLGFYVYSLPTIGTVPLELTDAQKDSVKHLSDFDWLVFTSAKSVQYFIGVLFQLGIQWPLDKPSVAAIGSHTAQAIEDHGVRVTFKPTHANNNALGNELTPVNGTRILLPHTDIASNDLATQLTRRGGKVTSLSIYATRFIKNPDKTFLHKLKASTVDFLVFASPSAVQGFSLQIADPVALQIAKSIPAIAIGSSAKSALKKDGYSHIYTSRTATIDGIIEVLQRLVSQ